MKPMNVFDALVLFLAGVVLGATVLWIVSPHGKTECVTGRVILGTASIIIGEAIVCGEFHSKAYGPTLEAWTGDILFYHDHEEE